MGQTLTNGIYLPDEGERNAYSGLEANWRTLDALILTVNGKAAPNVANTWTAAQTFTAGIAGDLTGNVTGDLTGTASKAIADEDGTSIKTGYVNVAGNQTVSGQKTWSGNQFFTSPMYPKNTSYEIGNTPASNVAIPIYFTDKNSVYTGYVRSTIYTSGRSATEIRAKNAFKNGVLDPTGSDISSNLNVEVQPSGAKTIYWDGLIRNDVTPYTTNNNSLGSSTSQWSSVYAQTYYYNGTEWGLDRNNTWTGSNTFSSILNQNINSVYSEIPSSDHFAVKGVTDNNGDNVFVISFADRSSGQRDLTLRIYNTDGTQVSVGLYKNSDSSHDFKPMSNGLVNLGTSTNKWKTLNGINPGALSLPNYDSSAKIDISGSIIPDQYGNIYYTPTINGWLYVCFNVSSATTSDTIFYIQAKDNNVANSNFIQTSWALASVNPANLAIFFPVVANKRFIMQINFSNYTIIKAHVIPCLGNV